MTIPDDMNELTDVSIDRVDLVGKAANGHRFILAKSAADGPNLIDADTVRDLIKEADADNPEGIDVTAALTAVFKAGRALSSANEAALRNAAEAIQKVLASLPAPEEAPIEKETPVAENPAAETIETPDLTKAADADAAPEAVESTVEDVAKASMMAVYDAKGNLVGVIKPSALTVVDSGPAPADEEPEEAPVEEVEASAEPDDTAADDVQPEDGAPADTLAEDEALIPGTETIQSPVEKGTETVTQAPDVAALLKEALAPLVEKIAATADLAGAVEVLKGQVEALGREPDDRHSPLLNGATGTAGVAKRAAETDELADLKKAVEDAAASGDPAKISNAQQAYAFASVRNRFAN